MTRTVLHGSLTDEAQMGDRSRAIESDADLAVSERWQPLAA
jgi:hypothetical protein